MRKSVRGGREVSLSIEAAGRGIHELELRLFNGAASETVRKIDFSMNENQKIEWAFTVPDILKPWVAVIIPDTDYTFRKELTGVAGN